MNASGKQKSSLLLMQLLKSRKETWFSFFRTFRLASSYNMAALFQLTYLNEPYSPNGLGLDNLWESAGIKEKRTLLTISHISLELYVVSPSNDITISISLHSLVFLNSLGLPLTHLQRRISYFLLLKALHMQLFIFNLYSIIKETLRDTYIIW